MVEPVDVGKRRGSRISRRRIKERTPMPLQNGQIKMFQNYSGELSFLWTGMAQFCTSRQ